MRSWAAKAGIQQYSLSDAVKLESQFSADILFSIGNYSVIPDSLLKRARRMSINYHYGPLPEYSGLHVPAWAVHDRATDYAITWHRIGEIIDGGSILKRMPVPIESTDTALSLGLKCDETAIQSFGTLVDDLAAGREQETPQDLSRRRYFSRHSQISAEGLIDWNQDAEQIAALVRATDNGPFSSPLVWPKVLIDDRILAVRKASIGARAAGATPGDVLAVDANGASIATGNRAIRLESLCTLEGADVSLADLVNAGSLQAGASLASADEPARAQVTVAGTAASEATAFWRGQLAAYQPYRLPYSRPASPEINTAPIVGKLPAAPKGRDQEQAFVEQAVGGLCTFLARASGVTDVHVAIAAACADVAPEYRDVFCAWTPLLVQVDPAASVSRNLEIIAKTLRDSCAHGLIRRDLIGRDAGLAGRFQRGELTPDVLVSSKVPASYASDEARPALEFVVLPGSDAFELHFNPRKITRRTAAQLAAQWADWCRRLPDAASLTPGELDALPASEKQALLETFNNTGNEAALGAVVHQLFEQAAAQHESRVALRCADQEMSYGELNAAANRLASALRQKGVKRGQLVGVCLDRSIDMVVALLAVLKSGAAYVPVDMDFPAERIRQMLEAAQPALLIAPPAARTSGLRAWADRCLDIEAALADAKADSANPPSSAQAEDLAYVIFTSGSTGKPKGVEVTHGALGNFLLSMRTEPGCDAADSLLAVTTISFDIAALELFLPLISGASVVIARQQESMDGQTLLALMQRHAVTMMQATPTTWQLLLQSGWQQGASSLKRILCGGEALPRQLADELLARAESVWNMYGPTETTVWSSVWQVRPGEDIVIGKPIANTQLYVLDANLSLVPAGFPGELCIGGAGVARGYHKDAAQTRAQFGPNPFAPGSLYRTGDLACFKEPGKLVVLGRNDGQIKLRGFRIELGEVEDTVASHEDISRAVVVGRNDQLVAYCLRNSAPSGAMQDRRAENTAVTEWRDVWDRAYEPGAADPSFNTAGWHNSYDGLPFSADEMRDWQKSTVDRILSNAPERVFEIGSGTGLVLFGVAPKVSQYRAIDASSQAVEKTNRHLSGLPQASCEHRLASDLPDVEPGSFDTVVINSVAQYFPNAGYLLSVLDWATKAVTQGRIFIGDVRDLSLLEAFHADVANFQGLCSLSADELNRRVQRALRSERELVLSPEFFANLPTAYPQITRVEVALRDGGYVNEMTRFRYDVTLHIGVSVPASARGKPQAMAAQDWKKDRLDLPALAKRLAKGDKQLTVANIPNGRLADVQQRVGHVLSVKPAAGPGQWVDPRDLKQAAEAAGYQMRMLPSRERDIWAFDAVFWKPGAQPDFTWQAARPMDRDALSQFANQPTAGAPPRPVLQRVLRPWLETRLPGYMIPDFFVELDEFPLTPNGKIDRKALPEPTEVMLEPAVQPTNELEQQLQAVWADVLGHDRIGINDSFFKIGGNSLRVVRVQAELQKLLGRNVSTSTLYEHFTIKDLAAYLAGNKKVAALNTPKRRNALADEPIAIVSMACRLPGNVNSAEDLWTLLERGGDGIVEVPKERWDAAAIYDADPDARGKSYCMRGGFVAPIDLFDAPFFGISPREARALDPAQRMMLEVTSEAIELAGYSMDQLRGSQTGVFIGIGKGYHEYGLALAGGLADLDGYVGTGSAGSTMSGRVSYVLGLEGPSMTVDTACSSSLVTTHLACNALRQGECDLAVAAGVTLMLSPDLHVEFSRLRGMSPDGRCKSFSSNTDGTGWSEGAAVVVLKRLSDAQRDGDPILAVLRGTAVNHAGHSASLTTPSGPAQQRVIRQALSMSGLKPADIDYLEAHGTGTKLGDPIEANGLADVFGGSHTTDKPLWVGSVKSNLGHTQAAAGLAGVMKAVLAMHHDKLPITLHVVEPTPAVDWAAAQMALVQQEQPWLPGERPRRAGVSSFGIGGTNAHVIVEEPPKSTAAVKTSKLVAPPETLPFVLSGFTVPALRAQADKLHLHMGMNIQDRFLDVAYSLATSRTHFRKRLVVFAKGKSDLLDSLAAYGRTGELPAGAVSTAEDRDKECRLALLFTGQGSQLPGMGHGLYQSNPVFKQALDDIAQRFTSLEKPLLEVMFAQAGSADAALLNRTDFTQPALFALEVALWRVWESWGVQPDLLLGHSIGEIAAAHVAGVFDLDDACRLVAARGRLMQALPAGGGMASLEASGAEAEAALAALDLGARVSLAGLNAPQQTVVSGDIESIERVVAHFKTLQRKAKRLEVSHAFHSHLLEPMLEEFRQVAESLSFVAPKLMLVSSLTGVLAKSGEMTQPEYWVQQARQAVRFNAGMRTLYEQGVNTFLELGPQPVLAGMGAACLADDGPVAWVTSINPAKDEALTMQKGLAELHVLGAPVNWRGFFAPYGGDRVKLPCYAFQRERYWLEPMPTRAVGAGLNDADHQLLGGGVRIAGTDLTMFTTVVADDEPAWVQEHQVMDAVLMPGTAFFEAMRAAGKHIKGQWDLADVIILAPMVLTPGAPLRMQITVGAESAGVRTVHVYSSPESDEDADWQLHAEGKLVPAQTERREAAQLPPPDGDPIDVTALYQDLHELGYGYGPTFQGITAAWHVDGDVWARVALPEAAAPSAIRYGLHPALLDSSMHSLLLTQRLKDQVGDDVFVPFEAERLSVWKDGLAELWVRVAEFEMGEGEFWASLDLYDATGEHVGRLHRLHARRIDRAALRRLASAGVDRYLFRMEWQPVEAPEAVFGGTWGLMGGADTAWADEVRTRLAQAGAQIIDISQLNEAEACDGVIQLWGADKQVVEQSHRYASVALLQVQELALAGFAKPMIWVTRGAVGTSSDDPVADLGISPLWGLLRTARNEHPELNLRIIDLGEHAAGMDPLAAALALEGEPECAVRGGKILAARLKKAPSTAGLALPADGNWRLEIATKGRLDQPLSVKTVVDEPLAAGEIRAAVKATGVNFLDVLNALGMVEIPALGLEFAGVVTEVGSAVKHLKPGDPVLGLARGAFGSSIVVDARQVVAKPENLSFEEAATIPMTFLTAWYGLHILGNMQPGERVLVHAAAGGVGMAAVQLALLHGAEVYGTASEPKWPALRKLGLEDSHIGSSRSLDFAQEFAQTAPGRSFDIVLNSLAREFIDASFAMLKPGGRFLEMGKIDLRDQTWVEANHPGVTYRVYNLPEAGVETIQQMLTSIATLFAEGKLKPLPLRTFPLDCASDALRFIAQARHVGKVVLVPMKRRSMVEPDGAVLVTGGLGGLGRYVSKWLVQNHHVRDLVLTSRSGMTSPDAESFVAELAELGARATVVACDAADYQGLESVVGEFSEARPLRGVVHAAGILDDGMLSGQTPERFDTVFAPKVDGAWHLHQLTQDLPLDFFVLFSSISGVTGAPGQGNYAAANTFLDALAHHRRAKGLAATSVAWGAWDGQGMASRLSDADKTRFSRQGMEALGPTEALDLFESAVMSDAPAAVAAALDLGRLQRTLEDNNGGAAPALYRDLFSRSARARGQGAGGGGSGLRKLLVETVVEQRETVVLEAVRAEVAKALEFASAEDVDVSLPLQDIGIDSLTAVLLRNQLSDMTGLALPAKIAFDHPNLRALSQFLLEKLTEAGLESQEAAPVEGAAPKDAAGAKRMDDRVARRGFLEPDLQFDNVAAMETDPEAVFVTGATGFVGAFLLHELLSANVIAYCLVRADDAEKAMARQVEILQKYDLWKPEYAALLNPVVGDLTQPLFGLSEHEFDQLANQVDAICHSGALVDWMLPLDNYLAPNVVGTHEVLRLASRGCGKAVHFVSTAATLPRYLGYEVSKEEREFGYLSSKYMAEQMVAAARRRGARASIYRLPFVGASSASGHFRLDKGDFLHNLISGCIAMGNFPLLGSDIGGVLPVDYLARVIAQVMTRDQERIGKDYDFANPNAPGFNSLVQHIRGAGVQVGSVPFDQWKEEALAYAQAHPKSSIARIAAVLDGLGVQSDLEQMFDCFPVGDDVFGGAVYACPPVDGKHVQPYVERIVAALPARQQAQEMSPVSQPA
ncbi:amino acid adenylation domain-containing protein [Achromobacter pestifer]